MTGTTSPQAASSPPNKRRSGQPSRHTEGGSRLRSAFSVRRWANGRRVGVSALFGVLAFGVRRSAFGFIVWRFRSRSRSRSPFVLRRIGVRVWRSAFAVRRSASRVSVQRSAFSGQRSAFSVQRSPGMRSALVFSRR